MRPSRSLACSCHIPNATQNIYTIFHKETLLSTAKFVNLGCWVLGKHFYRHGVKYRVTDTLRVNSSRAFVYTSGMMWRYEQWWNSHYSRCCSEDEGLSENSQVSLNNKNFISTTLAISPFFLLRFILKHAVMEVVRASVIRNEYCRPVILSLWILGTTVEIRPYHKGQIYTTVYQGVEPSAKETVTQTGPTKP